MTPPATTPRLPPPPPRWLARAVLALRRGLHRAADRLVPPQLVLFEQVVGVGLTHALAVVARLRVADRLEERAQSAAELAVSTGVDPDALHRVLRGLSAGGLFRLDAEGRFHNARLAGALRTGAPGSLRDFAEYMGSASNARAWIDFAETVRTGRNAFERVHGRTVWEWFDDHPPERETFARAMSALTELDAPAIAAAYPFGEIARLCDLGGGRGTLLAEVLRRHTGPRGLLVDAAGVLDEARVYLGQRGLLERVELLAGDFFAAVPAGCDGYLLKNVLHDWDDERSLALLRRCRAAMQPATRLLVVEVLVEKSTTDGIGPLSDLQMMTVCCEGRERGLEEYAALFAAADLRLRRVVATAAPPSVLEATTA